MSSSSTAATFSLDHLQPSPTEQLCYVHCNFCDTVLAVSVPYTSLFKTVTVRCGHCSNLLSVNMRALHLPPPTNQIQLGINNTFLSPTSHISNNLLEEITCPPLIPPPPPPSQPSLLLDHHHHHQHHNHHHHQNSSGKESIPPTKRTEDSIQQPPVNRPPEKRQRVPSAYNRFIKDEIQRIKAGNPDITHREAFSAAAKNWAHFPHIHFGLMPDQGLKKNNMRQQDGSDHENLILKDGFYAAAAAAAANMGVTPF